MAADLAAGADDDPPWLVLTRRVSRSVGRALADAGIAYVDQAGNCHIEHAGLYVHVEGLSRPSEPRGRGLGAAGYHVLFALLVDEPLLTRPVRTIEAACGASRQAVSSTLVRLEQTGMIARRGRDRAWIAGKRPAVARQWLAGYESRVRPKLLVGHYAWPPAWSDDELLEALGADACWGGTTAANRLQDYYDPPERTVHIRPDASVRAPLRVSDADAGRLTVLRHPAGTLWRWPGDAPVVHPLYAWAEMMASPDDRAHDAARVLLEEYVPELV